MKRIQIAAFFCLAILCACKSTPVPGDRKLQFQFIARPAMSECLALGNAAANFNFDAWVSFDTKNNKAFFSSEQSARDGTFDDQFFETSSQSQRFFENRKSDVGQDCSGCQVVVNENIRFAILSLSQFEAISNQCVDNILSGGLPQPNADAGITPPQMGQSYDAVRACGELHDVFEVIEPDGGTCPLECRKCEYRYFLDGVRRE